MLDKLKAWSASDTPAAKCTRTIAQGVIGVLVAYAAEIVASFSLDTLTCAVITALVMAVLAPIQAQLGGKPEGENNDEA
jgi:hypothetical protein